MTLQQFKDLIRINISNKKETFITTNNYVLEEVLEKVAPNITILQYIRIKRDLVRQDPSTHTFVVYIKELYDFLTDNDLFIT